MLQLPVGGGHPEPVGTVSGKQKNLFSPPFSEPGSEGSAGGCMDCHAISHLLTTCMGGGGKRVSILWSC